MTDELRDLSVQISKEKKRQLAALRHPFEGVFNVFAFNWPKYILGVILTYILVIMMMVQANPTLKPVYLVPAALIVFWMVVSLLVSFIVYDSSDLYKYNWLLGLVKNSPAAILNLHAGFDESSKALRILFPDAKLEVYDFYSGIEKTEPSIDLARSASESKNHSSDSTEIEPVSVGLSGWQLKERSQDLVLLLMSAHEVREPKDREEFFSEIHRVLKPGGQCIVVEHMRDVANFFAYGPGFVHFHPRGEWLRLSKKCGFETRKEKLVTPFVRVFSLCKT